MHTVVIQKVLIFMILNQLKVDYRIELLSMYIATLGHWLYTNFLSICVASVLLHIEFNKNCFTIALNCKQE